MPNPYFKFKQFTVLQDKCAMKVCTDACLFGGLVANEELSPVSCLDIGTGTGLLSLMVAQRFFHADIDAVEIDEPAASQAAANMSASPWKERLQVINCDILSYAPGKKYDLVFSNPPFYEGDLLSPDEKRNRAMHHSGFSIAELAAISASHLSEDGILAVLLPYHRLDHFIREAGEQRLYLTKQILIRQSEEHGYFRAVLFFGRKKTEPIKKEMSIKDRKGAYTPEFIDALKNYYLYL